jgi:hypothetical protein
MHKSATKCNETLSKWCKNKHGASKIIDTFETYLLFSPSSLSRIEWALPLSQRRPKPVIEGSTTPCSTSTTLEDGERTAALAARGYVPGPPGLHRVEAARASSPFSPTCSSSLNKFARDLLHSRLHPLNKLGTRWLLINCTWLISTKIQTEYKLEERHRCWLFWENHMTCFHAIMKVSASHIRAHMFVYLTKPDSKFACELYFWYNTQGYSVNQCYNAS